MLSIMMEQYVFKYDKQNNLYCYIERNKKGKILSYFNLTDNKLIRYDSQSRYKYLIDYLDAESCKLAQRFQESESWVTILQKSSSIYNKKNISGITPMKSRELCVKGKEVIHFTVGREFLDRFKYVSTSTYKNLSFASLNEGNVNISSIY